jgi:hypothetical protein
VRRSRFSADVVQESARGAASVVRHHFRYNGWNTKKGGFQTFVNDDREAARPRHQAPRGHPRQARAEGGTDERLGGQEGQCEEGGEEVSAVTYYAVYRSDTTGDPEAGYSGICVGLFGEIPEALQEAQRHLTDGYHVSIDRGSMSQEEWDALEEVPDDFVAADAASEITT